MKTLLLVCGLSSAFLVAGVVGAEPFASHGTVAIGAERMFGVEHVSETRSQDGLDQTDSTTSISLLGHVGAVTNPLNPSTALPRLSVDVFLGPGVSLGGGILYEHMGQGDQSDRSVNFLLFAPRLGFGARLSDNFAIWPRFGVTYLHLWSSSTATAFDTQGNATTIESRYTMDYTLLALEAMCVFTPVEHVGFSFGPTLDYRLGISQTTDGTDVPRPNTSMYAVGLHAGLLVWL